MVKKTPRKKPVKKPAAKSKPVRKAPAKKILVRPAKPIAKAAKPAAKASKPLAKPAKVDSGKTVKPVLAPARGKVKCPVDKKNLEALKDAMIRMRERLTGQVSALSDDSLKYIDDQSTEDRTDDFDREFALNLVSSEHDAIFEIDEALRRIKERTYGVCVACGCPIEKPRLQALPFARMCVRCQSETERGRTRFRPFGETITQGVEQVQETPEPEEVE